MLIYHRDELTIDILWAALQTASGLMELAIALACVGAGWLIARRVYRRFFEPQPGRLDRFLPYVGFRVVLPIASQVLVIASAAVWVLLLKRPAHVLPIVSAMLFWLAVIRVLAAMLRQAMPKGRFERGSEQSLSVLLWLAFITWAIGADSLVIDWLQSVTFHVGKSRLDLLIVITAILWVAVILVGAMWVSRLIDNRLMRVTELDMNLRIVFSKLARTILIVAAVLIALPIVGIDLTVLSVFGGALGVGLGFGLQKIASNYVSGFIILLDRSIRIGDRLMVDNRVGYVSQITARYVVLKGLDGSEALVPNDTLIANTVINQSYSDKAIWTSLQVQVAYGTDLDLALKLMGDAAQHPRLLKNPAPAAFVTAFGDNGITLELGFWVSDPENGFMGLKSDLNLAIWRSFKEHGVAMPFPQREVRILNPAAMPGPSPSIQEGPPCSEG
ncbi:mechanosensitive ion channel family protein [Crenobacter cavernae]|uniref:mechanosensitive ion channel family protein n=1 Tax=Crenobacter cavernae TaxID=2290923 RepID=UPI001F0CBE38|nr:mechanosensitive ion channel domain-containing protein [Crenobacter cavernae]